MSSLAGVGANLAATGATVGLTRLLFRSKPAEIGAVQLDASVREVHNLRAKVTKHPVEQEGTDSPSVISDHVFIEPVTISIEGVISNWPAVYGGAVRALLTGGFDKADKAYKQFEEHLKKKQLLDVVTTLKTYKNMILENVTVNRDAAKGNALYFSATATQVTFVTLETTAASEGGSSKPYATQSAGKTPPKTPSPSAVSKVSTIMKAAKPFIPWLP